MPTHLYQVSKNRNKIFMVVKISQKGSGCGSVGRVVASDTRGPQFESSHRQNLLNICLLSTVYWKDKNKEKEAGNGPFFKNISLHNW